MKNFVLLTFLVLLAPTLMNGQLSSSLDNSLSPQSGKDSLDSLVPDSLILRYFKLSDITTMYDFRDSTLDNFFHQYDPAKRRNIDFQTLGNVGSSARNQQYESTPYVGFHPGQRQYDLYNFKLDDFRFYQNNIPISDVSFTPIAGQQNFVIRTDFARDFADGTSLSLNYRRIRQQGFYTNQLTKITNFGVALRYQSKNERYTGFLSMISNVNEEGHNGGVQADTVFQFYNNPLLGNRINVPINSDDAQTRNQQKQYTLTNYYQLNKPTKSGLQLLLRYDLSLDSRYYKFSDETTNSSRDSTLYGKFLVEDRGIRFYNRINRISNAFYAYASNGDRLNIRAGLVFDRYDIDQQGLSSSYNNLYADFKGSIPITSSLDLSTIGKLGLGDGTGDFLLKGLLSLDVGDWIDLTGGASLYRYTPDLMQRNLVINGDEIYDNTDFVKPVGTDLFGKFAIPKLRIKGEIKQSLITNYIYYNEDAFPEQPGDVLSATTISVANDLQFGKVGLKNYLMLQVFSDNVLNLPTFYSKHNLYVQGWMWDRALLARLGTEVRLAPTTTTASYSPVVGAFYQSDSEAPFYPMTDIYFTGKIKTARIFLRFENVVNLIDDRVQYQIAYHPQFDFKIRFGVSWLLLN